VTPAFFSIGAQELVVILLSILLVVWPFWRIFSKAGFPGWLAIGMLFPLLNVALLFVLAFAKWPALSNLESRQGRPYDPEGALEKWGGQPNVRRPEPPSGPDREDHVQQ
jgi:hypothetical protein